MTTFKAGKQQGLSGRDLFTFNPDFVANDNMETDGDIAQCDRSADDDNEVFQLFLFLLHSALFIKEDAKTFDINENTFCTVDAEGKRLVDYDDNDNRLYDDEGNEMADIEGPNNSDQVDFDRELFDDVEDLPDSEDENEAGTSSQIRPKSSAESSDVEDLCHETNQRLIT